MANLNAALREEIWRQARKANRKEMEQVRKASAAHRRDIAKLKRELARAEKRLSALESLAKGRLKEATPEAAGLDGVRYSSRSVRAQRKRLGLSAEEYGKLVGVSTQTIYFWEQGKTKPREKQLAALVAVRGITKREAAARLGVLE